MTKTELRNYRALAEEVRQIRGRMQELTAGRSFNDLDDEYFDLVEMYHKKWAEAYHELLDIEEAMNKVTDPTERLLLRYRYEEGHSWERVAEEMHYSYTQVQRIHGSALKHIGPKYPMSADSKDCSGLVDE